jgi:hypothetical protein
MTASTRRPRTFLLLLAAAALLLAACGTTGSGNIVTETRDVGSFDRIETSGGVRVELTVDPNLPTSVEVSYDDNLLDNVVTDVSGDTLEVKLTGSINTSGSGRRVVTVVTQSLVGIAASGGSSVSGTGVTGAYQADASGGANLELRKLEATSVEIDASGGANVNVYATESATGEASGGANVSVFGNPTTMAVETSGGADLDIEN